MRKGIRKVISALLVVIVIFASVPLAGFVGLELPEINLLGTKAEAAISGKCGDNLTWTFDDIKYELVISGTGDMYDYSVSSVTPNTPWFKYHTYIDNIIISDGVTSIGNCAFFRCESLKSIIIPDSVTSIGVIAFTYCESLTSITLGNGIKTIGNSAFSFALNSQI